MNVYYCRLVRARASAAFSRVTNHNRSNNTSQMIVSISSSFIEVFFVILLYLSLSLSFGSRCPIIRPLRNVVDREARLVPVLRTDEFSPPSSFCICTHGEHRARKASSRSISVTAASPTTCPGHAGQTSLIHFRSVKLNLYQSCNRRLMSM